MCSRDDDHDQFVRLYRERMDEYRNYSPEDYREQKVPSIGTLLRERYDRDDVPLADTFVEQALVFIERDHCFWYKLGHLLALMRHFRNGKMAVFTMSVSNETAFGDLHLYCRVEFANAFYTDEWDRLKGEFKDDSQIGLLSYEHNRPSVIYTCKKDDYLHFPSSLVSYSDDARQHPPLTWCHHGYTKHCGDLFIYAFVRSSTMRQAFADFACERHAFKALRFVTQNHFSGKKLVKIAVQCFVEW